MINFATITKGVFDLFHQELSGYTIERNSVENLDENTASKNKGWIGIFKGPLVYSAERIGGSPWDVELKILVQIQCASFKSGKDAEDRLEDAVEEVMEVLGGDLKLNNTVHTTLGYEIDYDFDMSDEKSLFLQIAMITITAEISRVS